MVWDPSVEKGIQFNSKKEKKGRIRRLKASIFRILQKNFFFLQGIVVVNIWNKVLE